VQQLDADLVDAAAALGPRGHLVGEECLVEVGEGVHAGLLGPLGEVVVEQPRRRDVPGVLEDLAAVVAAGRRRGWPRRCSALTSSASLGG
jgi:hypothetical protein